MIIIISLSYLYQFELTFPKWNVPGVSKDKTASCKYSISSYPVKFKLFIIVTYTLQVVSSQ